MTEVQEQEEGGGAAVALALPPEKVAKIELEQGRLAAGAAALVIDSPESEADAWAIITSIGTLEKAIKGTFKEPKAAARKPWQDLCDQESAWLARLTGPDQVVRQKINDRDAEKRRRQAVAAEEARIEQRRLEAEARRQAEDGRLKAAIGVEEMGDSDLAAKVLDMPVEVAPVSCPVVSAPPKVAGAGVMVEVWKFEIVDATLIPRKYLTVNESAIGGVVRALKGETDIPGVRVYSQREARRSGKVSV